MVAAAAVLSATLAACAVETPPNREEIQALRVSRLPSDPADAAWEKAPVCVVPLIPQDMVEPRQMGISTPEVRVRALWDGERIAFRLAWDDSTRDDLPGAARFWDACAVQIPRDQGPDLPAPQMGETGRPVEITYWSASWQAVADGRPTDDIRALYPRAAVGHYPFEAQSLEPGSPEQKEMAVRYAPAVAVENFMAGQTGRPVQDLVAEGPGTLRRVRESRSEGRGTRTENGWVVEIQRPLPGGMTAEGQGHAAFAVWQGANQEVGARKMRSVWTPVRIVGGTDGGQ